MYEKKEKKGKEKKKVHTFSNRSLKCSWRSTVGYIFLQKEKNCSILELAVFDELLG